MTYIFKMLAKTSTVRQRNVELLVLIMRVVLSAISVSCVANADQPPKEWVDAATGHRVIRLSTEPGMKSLYFHQYPFSAEGDWMVMTKRRGLAAVNLQTRKVKSLVEGRVRVLMTGKRTGDVYYIRNGVVQAVAFDTGESRNIATIPENYKWASIAVNADETLLVGVARDPDNKDKPKELPTEYAASSLARGWAAGRARLIFTIDLKTDKLEVIHRSNEWINHLQCSPSDPNQILFCHEGPWHWVDRSWLLRTDGSGLRLVHPRTMDMEIAGHEFFGSDGESVWYDLQTPRSQIFWLAGYDLATENRTWYQLDREHWSVHYNVSPNGNLFTGDGGGPNSVANRSPDDESLGGANGQWIYLFQPKPMKRAGLQTGTMKLIKTGTLEAHRLVDLSRHDYSLEPNAMFTPDAEWIVFRSNMHGQPHTYAVSISKEIDQPAYGPASLRRRGYPTRSSKGVR